MKNYLILIIIVITLFSCGQSKQNISNSDIQECPAVQKIKVQDSTKASKFETTITSDELNQISDKLKKYYIKEYELQYPDSFIVTEIGEAERDYSDVLYIWYKIQYRTNAGIYHEIPIRVKIRNGEIYDILYFFNEWWKFR